MIRFTRKLKSKIDIGPTKKETFEEFKSKVLKNLEEEKEIFGLNQEKIKEKEEIEKKNIDKSILGYQKGLLGHSFKNEEEEKVQNITLKMSKEQYDQFLKQDIKKWNQKGYEYQNVQEIDDIYYVLLSTYKKDKKNDKFLKILAKNMNIEKLKKVLNSESLQRINELKNELKKEEKKDKKEEKKDKKVLFKNEKEEEKEEIKEEEIKEEEDKKEIDEYSNENSLEHFNEKEKELLKQEYQENEYDKYYKLLDECQMIKGNVRIPKDIEIKIEGILKGIPKNILQQNVQYLSNKFRIRTGGYGNKYNFIKKEENNLKNDHQKLLEIKRNEKEMKRNKDIIIYNRNESIAYVAHRLPSIYSTIYRVMNEIQKRIPNFEPKTVLDFGSGPGTSIICAKKIWNNIDNIIAIEPSNEMINISQQLLKNENIQYKRFLNENQKIEYDLVIGSYVLNEIELDSDRSRIIKNLWKMTKDILILIEPGTPLGFDLIREARSILLKQPKSNIIAPCTHHFQCPMIETSWCHFSVRYDRVKFQRITKEMTLAYGDEKFSYIVLSKKKHLNNNTLSRILYNIKKNKGHNILDLCKSNGKYIQRYTNTKKRAKIEYKFTRKLFWGDLFPF